MSQRPQRAAQPNRSRLPLILIAGALVLVVALVIIMVVRGTSSGTAPTPVPTVPVTTEAVVEEETTAAAPTTQVADPRLAECTTVTEGFVPNRYTIETIDAEGEVLALNLDADGNIAAPPVDQPETASWWSGGPMPGADEGRAILSIHTYNPSLSPAVGNYMYRGGQSQLKSGDLIKLYGNQGQVMCYEFTHDYKFFMDEYDPDSDVMLDFYGAPEIAIIICWDYDRNTRDWDSRVLFYASPVDLAA